MNFWYTMSVDYIRDLLTDICLVGAAATSVAWVMLINRGRMARAADRIAKTSRSAIAAPRSPARTSRRVVCPLRASSSLDRP